MSIVVCPYVMINSKKEKNMEIGGLHNKVNDPHVAQLIDNILDAVLALKARLTDSNMDSNSIGGISIHPLSPYNILMGTRLRTKAPKADQLKGELKGDLAAYEKYGVLLRYQLFLGDNLPSLGATC
jgi:hypothetical protein